MISLNKANVVIFMATILSSYVSGGVRTWHMCMVFPLQYSSSFPSLRLVIFGMGGSSDLVLFPFRRVSSNQKWVTSYAKFLFIVEVFNIAAGLAVMLALIIKYQDHLSLFSKIAQSIAYFFFHCLDLPLCFCGCTGKDNGRDSGDAIIPTSHAPAPAY